jgi:hypothetical protein
LQIHLIERVIREDLVVELGKQFLLPGDIELHELTLELLDIESLFGVGIVVQCLVEVLEDGQVNIVEDLTNISALLIIENLKTLFIFVQVSMRNNNPERFFCLDLHILRKIHKLGKIFAVKVNQVLLQDHLRNIIFVHPCDLKESTSLVSAAV